MLHTQDLPAGFEPHFRKSPVTDAWEPLYSKRTSEAVHIGLRLAPAHTNGRGFAHGGLIAALADNAMGLSCTQRLSSPAGFVTVGLSVDFVSVARVGQWLEFQPAIVKIGSTLCFAQCLITADGAVCSRANATFSVLAAKPAKDETTT